ncbi:MAG TPA: DNA glycosylase [Nitrosopumilaceae archaeon]|nr:DNA glycosylase [Nitrosopumilaceae archaeon]
MQEIQKIDLDTTINSGQVFLWDKIGDAWYGVNGSEIIKIVQDPFRIISSENKISNFFRQDDNMKIILQSIRKDTFVRNAILRFPGLRLLRQDPFQCYISFICSSNASIPNIKQMLKKISKKFGKKINFDGHEFHTFPIPEKLANSNITELLSCGLGFRAKYVKKASQEILSGRIDFKYLTKTDYKTSKAILLEVYGIGNKIADCILLFSLEKIEAFPIDRWTLRILRKYYSDVFDESIVGTITKKKYEEIHERIVGYFGPFAGYSQQFLFKMERDLNNKKWL